jgi:hypothetical protein
LLQDLVAGTTYQISMMVLKSNKARIQAPDLGFHLSTGTGFNQATGATWLPITLTPAMNNPYGGYLDNLTWLPFTLNYVAAGGERYLTIGNFLQNPGIITPPVANTFSSGYYFIDNVSVTGPDAVPEPATLGLAVVALAAIGLARQRSRAPASGRTNQA